LVFIVPKTSGVILPSSFTLEGQSELKEDTQIWSDGKNVSDAATVTVNAQGYDEYYIGESNNSKKWTNKELRNVAIINKDKKVIYQTIQGAIDNAVEQDEILVAPGTYDVTYVNGNTKHYLWVNKSVTLMAADMEEKPILTADFKQVNSQAGGQQQTVFVTADNVTLDGLIVYSITDYPTSYTKVIEIENANCAVIKNCKLYDEGRTAIYLGGTKVGKYTIEDNILDGAIVVANGAGNGDKGNEAIIKGNTINGSISFTGKTNSGWDPNSIDHYPTIVCNNINGTSSGMFINSRDIDGDKLISDEVLVPIIENNMFPEGDVRIVRDSYEYYNKETHRKRLMLNPPVYNEKLKTYHMSIQDAIDAATAGDNIIKVYPGNHGTDAIQIIQNADVNITLEAVGEVVLKNQIQIDGNGRSAGDETLTIIGFTFDFSDGDGDIITTSQIKSTPGHVYAHNVSIEDCKFIGNPDKIVVAVRADAKQGGHYGFEIKECTGEDLHSLAQLTSLTGVTVENCTVDSASEGLNLQNSTNITITDLTVDAKDYGVRAGQSSAAEVNQTNKLTILDSNLKAKYPIWLRNDAPGTVLINDSELIPSTGGKMINNQAGAGVTIIIDGAVFVTTEAELKAALANKSVDAIILGDDIQLSNWVVIGRSVVLNGNDKTIFGVKNNNGPVLQLDSNGIEIKHVTIKSKGFDNDITAGINIANGGHGGIVIDDVTFENTRFGVYANKLSEVEITNSVFKNLNAGIGIEGEGVIIGNKFSKINSRYVENVSTNLNNESIIDNNEFDTVPVIDGINIRPAQE